MKVDRAKRRALSYPWTSQGRNAVAKSNKSSRIAIGRAIVGAASVAASLLSSHAVGATYTWNGSTSTSWSNDSNWAPNTGYAGTATTADEALFAGTPPSHQPSLDGSYTVGTLLFSTVAGGWTLGSASSSNILSVNSALTTSQTSGTDTISANLDYGGTETWQAGTGGTLSITGSVNQNNGSTYELTIGGSGLGTVSLNPSVAADNITGANGTALVNVLSGASLQLGGTGGSANTFSNTFNDTVSGSALRFGSSSTTSAQSLVQVNSGRWNFTQIGANSTQSTTGKMNIVGGTVATGSAYYFGSYYGTTATNLTVNGGAFLVSNGGANTSNYGFNIGATSNAPASGVVAQTNLQSGFFDVATDNGGVNNSIYAPIYTGAGTTSYDLAEFNVSGGVAQFGVTGATNIVTGAGTTSTGGDTVTIGYGATTDTGSFLTGSLSAVTLSGGTLSAQAITGGVIAGTNTITNVVRNFNFVGGTLSAGTITMTNLGSAGAGAASSPFGSTLSAATSNNIGVLEDYGGTIAPGGSTYVYGSDSNYNPVLAATPTTGLTYINGGLQINSGTLLITLGGTTASTHFQDSPSGGFYSNLTATGAVALGGTLSLNFINSFFPQYSNSFTIVSGSSVTGDFSNSGIGSGSGTLSLANGASFLVTYNPTNVVLSDYTAPNLTWAGTPSATWDNGTSTAWVQSGTSTPSVFAAGDVVFFTNAGINNNSVNINAQVSPSGVMFGQTTGNTYTLSGTGGITGSTSLILAAGSGTLAGGGTTLLQTSDSYTGGTTINAGTLIAGNASALGTVASTITLATASAKPTLDIQVAPSAAYPTAVTGTGTAAIVIDAATALTPAASDTLGTLAIPAATLDVTLGSNVTGSGSLAFGTTTLSGAAVLDTGANTTVTLGAVAGAYNLTKQDSGTLVLNTTSTRTTTAGTTALTGGTLVLGVAGALNTSASAPLSISGGATLQLNGTGSTTFTGTATTVGGTATVADNINSSGTAAIATLGTLSIGSYQLNATGGSAVTSGTAGVSFGATTFTGNPTFNVTNPSGGGNTVLTLGSLADGSSPRTITFSGSGTTTLGTAASSLVAGTVVDISGATLNLTNATALGTTATVNVTGGGTFIVGASEAISALANTDSMATDTVALGTNTLTVGNGTDNLSSTYTGAFTGTGGIITGGSGTVTLGNMSGLTRITHGANSGTLTLGTITGIGTLTDNSTTGSTTPTTIAQSGSGLGVGTINGVSGSVVDFGGDTTGSTTITNVLGVKGQLVQLTNGTLALGSARHTLANLEVDGGTLLIGQSANRLGLDGNTSATQTLTITGGTVLFNPTSAGYGLRVNGDSGPAANNSGNISGVAVTVNQTGGTLSFTGTGNANYLQLGSTSSSNTTTYNMSAGTISSLVNSGTITLGADTAGTSQTTFNFSGGNILSYNGVAGSQGAGAKQAFVWTGGTLSVGTFNATNLASTTGSSTYGTLNNNGGTLAPGGVGTTGLTTIVGNYAGNGTGVLAFDINGASPSSSFQDTGAGSFDLVSVNGSVALNDRLAVTVLPGYVPPSSSTTYAVITSTSLVSGTFSGLTLVSTGIYSGTTTDGGYTYEAILNDGGDNVTLTDFQAVPEPGSIGAIVCGVGLLTRRRRRVSYRLAQAVAGS